MFIGFLENVVVRFTLMSPLRVPNVSPIGARIRVLWRILQMCEKKKKTTKKKTLTSAARIFFLNFFLFRP